VGVSSICLCIHGDLSSPATSRARPGSGGQFLLSSYHRIPGLHTISINWPSDIDMIGHGYGYPLRSSPTPLEHIAQCLFTYNYGIGHRHRDGPSQIKFPPKDTHPSLVSEGNFPCTQNPNTRKLTPEIHFHSSGFSLNPPSQTHRGPHFKHPPFLLFYPIFPHIW